MGITRKKAGGLTEKERKIVKALLKDKWRNQDIQNLINTGRSATINIARITEVKHDNTTTEASKEEVEYYKLQKNSYDQSTGLSKYGDERLVRAREAMILATQVFNSPSIKFKTEQFAVNAVIAWTYLLHEFYKRCGKDIRKPNNKQNISLLDMIKGDDMPISEGIKNNIKAIIEIRNEASHGLLGIADQNYFAKFQACCLNFDKVLCDQFGKKVSLQNELSLALQFAKLDLEQTTMLQRYDLPENIQALDKRLHDNLTEDQLNDTEYQFHVFYMLTQASKSHAHIHFVKPDSDTGREIHNVLLKTNSTEDSHPYKPQKATELIRNKSGRKFTISNHVQAWKKYEARPRNETKEKDKPNTKIKWCVYNKVYKSYTYSNEWIKFIVEKISTNDGYNDIVNFKP